MRTPNAIELHVIERQRSRLLRIVAATVLATLIAAAIALAAALDTPAAAAGGETARVAPADIVFTRHVRGTGRSDIFGVDADGSDLRQITRDGMSGDAAYSPDGRRIVFSSGRAHGPHAPELYVMDADGRRIRRLTVSEQAARTFWQNTQPVWSPDGTAIAFVRTEVRRGVETTDLWRVPVSGGRPTRLTTHPGREANPTFAPDGSLGFNRDGWIRQITRSGVLNLRPGADPAWSPDRTYLAFVKDDGISLTLGQSDRRIVERGSAPSWSPDGTRLAYTSADGGLQSVRVNGLVTQRLTGASARTEDIAPAWRPTPTEPGGARPVTRTSSPAHDLTPAWQPAG